MAYLMATVESLVKKGLKKAMKAKKRSASAVTLMTHLAIPILNRELGPMTRN
jgi:hypothetical protein